MPGNIYDPQHWLNRAEQIRTAAAGNKGPEGKALMLRIAQDYDKLAQRVAQRASPPTRPKNSSGLMFSLKAQHEPS